MQLFRILIYSMLLLCFACKAPNGNAQQSDHRHTNKLINESSPYLLQHAHNPVDWYPWGEEALAKAKAENKMMIISVGYAACHWCHVMEHESFEDSLVSKVMNEHFVCIKVDREERPDVDDVYMTACHLASGRSCGWPLNAFALPDGRPFWAGTYFPKKDWLDILDQFINLQKKNPAKLKEHADNITNGIQNNEKVSLYPGDKIFTAEILKETAKNFLSNIDFKKGGGQRAPKFPMPNNYQFLLSYHHLFQNQLSFDAVDATLSNMAWGGIYDHLGGGFARYSTDADWIVPHFEKMLYDNGQLVSLYAEAYRLYKNPGYKKVIEETLTFIERELTSPEGGFYSSLDADSEGEEGKFYVWTKEEIEQVLNDERTSKIFNEYYEIKGSGNWEHGKNILYRRKEHAQICKKYDLTTEALDNIIDAAKAKLFDVRSKRIRPNLDDKILTSWNSLMLKGYVEAYRATGNEAYLKRALKNGDFILTHMLKEGNRLNRNYKNGTSVINAFLDDYALTIEAFTALYQATFDEKWLYKAKDLTDYAITHFFDSDSGMFFYTSDIDPPLIARKMEVSDNVIPASNSSMARAMYTLGLYFYNNDYIEKSKQMMQNLKETVTIHPQPNFYSNWCSLYSSFVKPPYEVAIVGENSAEIRQEMLKYYTPNVIFLGGDDEGSLELLKDKLQEGETIIYVCQNKVCKFPVTEVSNALELMK